MMRAVINFLIDLQKSFDMIRPILWQRLINPNATLGLP